MKVYFEHGTLFCVKWVGVVLALAVVLDPSIGNDVRIWNYPIRLADKPWLKVLLADLL